MTKPSVGELDLAASLTGVVERRQRSKREKEMAVRRWIRRGIGAYWEWCFDMKLDGLRLRDLWRGSYWPLTKENRRGLSESLSATLLLATMIGYAVVFPFVSVGGWYGAGVWLYQRGVWLVKVLAGLVWR